VASIGEKPDVSELCRLGIDRQFRAASLLQGETLDLSTCSV